MATAGQIVAAFGALLVLLGGFYALAGRATVKETPFLGWELSGRITTTLGRAGPYIWRIGGVLLAVGLALRYV